MIFNATQYFVKFKTAFYFNHRREQRNGLPENHKTIFACHFQNVDHLRLILAKFHDMKAIRFNYIGIQYNIFMQIFAHYRCAKLCSIVSAKLILNMKLTSLFLFAIITDLD